jgi:hypothetical protein
VNEIYRYGKPIEVDAGRMPEYLDEEGWDQGAWEGYVLSEVQQDLDYAQRYGVANTEQYQRVSELYAYDPIDGAFLPFPF